MSGLLDEEMSTGAGNLTEADWEALIAAKQQEIALEEEASAAAAMRPTKKRRKGKALTHKKKSKRQTAAPAPSAPEKKTKKRSKATGSKKAKAKKKESNIEAQLAEMKKAMAMLTKQLKKKKKKKKKKRTKDSDSEDSVEDSSDSDSDSDSESESESEEEEEEEEEEEDVHCICRQPYDAKRSMIQCDGDDCKIWYHLSCVEITQAESDIISKYYCNSCVTRKKRLKTSYKSVSQLQEEAKGMDNIAIITQHARAIENFLLEKGEEIGERVNSGDEKEPEEVIGVVGRCWSCAKVFVGSELALPPGRNFARPGVEWFCPSCKS
jgi:hypothetical protein